MADRDEFYVGYLPQAPAALGRRLRTVIGALLVTAVVVALLLVTRQAPFGHGVFEFGIEREFVGIVLEEPYPVFFEMRPDGSAERGKPVSYLLSTYGQHGAEDAVRGLDLQPVRIHGSLIYRNELPMIEVHEVEPLSPEQSQGFVLPAYAGIDLGEVTLTGEIVDSKCYLGVMKPGHTKPHRVCAVRCISGGVPPILLVVDAEGAARHVVLASETGGMVNEFVLPYVAERVEITGTLRLYGNLELLYADPSTYRRIR